MYLTDDSRTEDDQTAVDYEEKLTSSVDASLWQMLQRHFCQNGTAQSINPIVEPTSTIAHEEFLANDDIYDDLAMFFDDDFDYDDNDVNDDYDDDGYDEDDEDDGEDYELDDIEGKPYLGNERGENSEFKECLSEGSYNHHHVIYKEEPMLLDKSNTSNDREFRPECAPFTSELSQRNEDDDHYLFDMFFSQPGELRETIHEPQDKHRHDDMETEELIASGIEAYRSFDESMSLATASHWILPEDSEENRREMLLEQDRIS